MGSPKKKPSGPFSDKLWRDALRVAALRLADDDAQGKTKLDKIAARVVAEAADGDIPAAKEIGDRLDGKVPQSVTGESGGPIALAISWLQPSG